MENRKLKKKAQKKIKKPQKRSTIIKYLPNRQTYKQIINRIDKSSPKRMRPLS